MGTKKNFGIVLFMYTIIIALLSISAGMLAGNASDCEIVTRVFRLTGANITGLQVNGWISIDPSEIAQESAVSYLQERLQKLTGHGFNGVIKRAYDGQSPVLAAEGRIKTDIYCRVVLKNAQVFTETEKQPTEAQQPIYLTVSVASANNSYTLADLNKYLLLLIPEPDLHRSITVSGSIPGRMSPRTVDKIVGRMVALTQAQNVERMETKELVSITGFSPYVRQRLTLGEKSVNINIACRYNSVQDRTFLYVGSPIITNDY